MARNQLFQKKGLDLYNKIEAYLMEKEEIAAAASIGGVFSEN